VVTNVGYDSKGGNYVVTANPGGDQFYYAHLTSAGENIFSGAELERGGLSATWGTRQRQRQNASFAFRHLL